jgi:hypothetical protein
MARPVARAEIVLSDEEWLLLYRALPNDLERLALSAVTAHLRRLYEKYVRPDVERRALGRLARLIRDGCVLQRRQISKDTISCTACLRRCMPLAAPTCDSCRVQLCVRQRPGRMGLPRGDAVYRGLEVVALRQWPRFICGRCIRTNTRVHVRKCGVCNEGALCGSCYVCRHCAEY